MNQQTQFFSQQQPQQPPPIYTSITQCYANITSYSTGTCDNIQLTLAQDNSITVKRAPTRILGDPVDWQQVPPIFTINDGIQWHPIFFEIVKVFFPNGKTDAETCDKIVKQLPIINVIKVQNNIFVQTELANINDKHAALQKMYHDNIADTNNNRKRYDELNAEYGAINSKFAQCQKIYGELEQYNANLQSREKIIIALENALAAKLEKLARFEELETEINANKKVK